jgi:hypothetical protein
MSAIRPGLPQTAPSQGSALPTARNAQAAFFRAALNQVQTTQVQATQVQTPAPNPTRPVAATAAADGETPRIMRPGTYLDIKV